jgi:molybdopterin-biosynthesis enzyme MoeA-like protein
VCVCLQGTHKFTAAAFVCVSVLLEVTHKEEARRHIADARPRDIRVCECDIRVCECVVGGIGPTHDDVTYQGIASAFGVDLVLHEPTLERMALHYQARGLEMNEMRKRMAFLPETSEVRVPPSHSHTLTLSHCESCQTAVPLARWSR